jgi:hypothetical protein
MMNPDAELIDDIDGRAGVETVCFELDGSAYEIDLSAGNASVLREVLARYIKVARRTQPSGPVASWIS